MLVGHARLKVHLAMRRRPDAHVGLVNRADHVVLADDADRLPQGRQEGEQVDQLLGRSSSAASPSGMSETSLVRRSSIEPGRTATRCPSAVLRTSRSGVSSTGRPVSTRPSVRATTCGTEVVADRRARVQDRAEQLVLAVLGADRREVGPDPLALPLHAVAAAAGIGAGAEEDLAAVVGVARRGGSARRSAATAGRGRLGQRQDLRGLLADAGGRASCAASVVASVFRSSGSLPARASSRTRLPPSLSWAKVRKASRRRPSG